jgi:hypothetical protein
MNPTSGIAEFLFQWKELIGALLGGLFAILVALIVARDARTREERFAAIVVLAALTRFTSRHQALSELALKNNVPAEHKHLWLGEKLTYSYTRLAANLEASISRLLLSDVHLAVNLEVFHAMHADLDMLMERISKDYTDLHSTGKPLRPTELMDAENRQAAKSFELAAKHARCASLRIEKLILSRAATWNRIRMKIRPTEQEKACLSYSSFNFS